MPPKLVQPSPCRVALTILVALVETLLFSGLVYGVVPLVPILERRGVYGHLCGFNSSAAGAENSTLCSSVVQDQVTLAFTVTQVVTPFGNLISGFMLDKLGFRAVKATAATLFGLGLLCFTLVQPGVDWLIFPGTMALGLSGIQVIITNLLLAPMVKFPFIIASLISGLFDACTMVTSTLVIITRSGVSSFLVFGVYTGLGVATMLVSIVIYPGRHSVMEVEIERTVSSDGIQAENPETKLESNEGQAKVEDAEVKPAPRGALVQQLLSTDLILMLGWMICNYLRLNYFFGSLNAYVQVITGDKQQVEFYATIFGYFFLASPLISLVPGALLDLQKRLVPALRQNTPRAYKLNTVTTLSLTGLLGALSCLLLLSNTAAMLIPVYIVIAVHRAFLFSTLSTYCISVFSPQYFGIIYTTIFCISGPFVFLTVPLTNWMKETRNPNPVT